MLITKMSCVTSHRHWKNPLATIGNMVRIFIENSVTISTAESCTGGYISCCITDQNGSSKIFQSSTVVYDPKAKQNELGVDPRLTVDSTIVSEKTAIEMNYGISRRLKKLGLKPCKVNISITGWIGSSPVKEENNVFFSLGDGEYVETHNVYVSKGKNKREKKELLVKRIFLDVLDYMHIPLAEIPIN